MSCELCATAGETLLWGGKNCRVILVDDADFPGFCRVIWNEHIKEMTDLPTDLRDHFMHIVFAVERAVREVVQPEKINLASLGNMTPHLHWHVIPRFSDDATFPQPIWANALRPPRIASRENLQARLSSALQEIFPA